MNDTQIEKYSSALTLSDMEIFVFPELMYSLVLADIMSPVIWKWRQEECFQKLEGKSSYKRLMRLKQFIMDNYEFNLDLETWGLTSKKREVERFGHILPMEVIAKSNALFGYEGDSYYFDVDIRKHFGLDKYDSDIIPYWKTETVEAMEAFRHKPGYKTGAGECVSLSALYAAAAFIVCGVAMEDIYMILTPLHSQNFFDVEDGVLSNNRRIVTKPMWFNGTALSDKAQRALRNEQVTIIAHNTGHIHCVYKDATIDPQSYRYLSERLDAYLTEELTPLIFANFLRSRNQYQQFFQFCEDCRGQARFIRAETLYQYEHSSDYRVADNTHEKLLAEVSEEDYLPYQLWERIRCDEFREFLQKNRLDLRTAADRKKLADFVSPIIPAADKFAVELAEFLHTKAQIPVETDKNFITTESLKISTEYSREQIISYLQSIRERNLIADIAFYVYRDMESCNWQPFVKAAVERNPVSTEAFKDKTIIDVVSRLAEITNESIYDGKRLAQPDEVCNYGRGDGVEKAFLLANVIRNRNHQQNIEIIIDGQTVIVKAGNDYRFSSQKRLRKIVTISVAGYRVN